MASGGRNSPGRGPRPGTACQFTTYSPGASGPTVTRDVTHSGKNWVSGTGDPAWKSVTVITLPLISTFVGANVRVMIIRCSDSVRPGDVENTGVVEQVISLPFQSNAPPPTRAYGPTPPRVAIARHEKAYVPAARTPRSMSSPWQVSCAGGAPSLV